jgi:hypothetical protein
MYGVAGPCYPQTGSMGLPPVAVRSVRHLVANDVFSLTCWLHGGLCGAAKRLHFF